MKKRLFIWVLVGWISVIVISFSVNIYTVIKTNNEKLLDNSRAFFGQILTMREWNSNHYGVYVPITEETQPNPYLQDSLRDITTTNGLKLTKINPAYMTRQLSELNKKNFGLKYHITSLNPIRPANYSDLWETEALKSFEKGKVEAFGLDVKDSTVYFRYMSPLITKESCLRCHSSQGYKFGDIRGGISVSLPYLPFIKPLNRQLLAIAFFHLLVLFLGILGLVFYNKRTNFYFKSINDKNIELNNLNFTKDKMYSIIAHDLKSPFNSIIGISSFVLENINNLDIKDFEESVDSINTSARNTKNLLDNLLEWTRAQTGKINYNPEKIILSQLLDESIAIFNSTLRTKNILISNQVEIELSVYADKNMLMTIFRNLISNAIKFTNINGFVKIYSEVSELNAVISVVDNGIGMEPEVMERLFAMDINLSTPGTMREQGSGLGLAITKEFIIINKGSIKVQSEKGSGSKFILTLPLCLGEDKL